MVRSLFRNAAVAALSLAKTIVERFDGKITLENAVPHGAVVRIEFPSIDAGN